MAVAEGNALSDLQAFVTFDGGVTWMNSFLSTPYLLPTSTFSLIGAAWVNDNEGWVSGATMDFFGKITALMLRTVDGGRTYSIAQASNNMYNMKRDWRKRQMREFCYLRYFFVFHL